MKVDAAVLIVLLLLGVGASAGLIVKSGVVYVPVLTDMARSTREHSASSHAWPPQVNDPYPDLELTGLNGQPVRLSDYRGKTLLVEPIAMSCKACQSFSGANDSPGPFAAEQGGGKQEGLESLETYLKRFADVSLGDPRLVYVHVLFYDLSAKRTPTLKEARQWAEHFDLLRDNVVVAIASPKYLSKSTAAMIPSFHLIDSDGRLVCDAGKPPKQDLYRELLPRLGAIIGASEPNSLELSDTPSQQ